MKIEVIIISDFVKNAVVKDTIIVGISALFVWRHHMIYRRERPKCHKVLIHLCKEYDCNLQQLLNHDRVFLSDGLKIQAHKMISEGRFKSAKELLKEQRTEHLQRSVGLIR